jgi:3' terminal RNA ribose 2'-O-methyltransferase Hen1
VEKLVRHGAGWLARHPDRELIARRFLKHRHSLTRQAIDRLLAADGALEGEASAEEPSTADEADEKGPSLNEQRLGAVLAVLKQSGAKRVLDLGCGEGKLVRALLEDRTFETIVAVDVSHRALEVAADRLKLERMPERQLERVQLLHGSLFYRDARLEGFDAAAIVEVIEHMEPARLPAFERVVFGFARPRTVVLTTPNAEHNVRFENLPEGQLRHHDHRFEWTRAELAQWARGVADRFGYEVRFLSVGPEDQAVGAPTQMAVFTR